jgi:hypothetical protein
VGVAADPRASDNVPEPLCAPLESVTDASTLQANCLAHVLLRTTSNQKSGSAGLKWLSDLTHRASVLGVANVVAGDINIAIVSGAPSKNKRFNEPIIVPLHIDAARTAPSNLTSGGASARRVRLQRLSSLET